MGRKCSGSAVGTRKAESQRRVRTHACTSERVRNRCRGKQDRAGPEARPAPPRFYCCSVLRRLAIASVEVAPAQTRTLSIVPGK